MIVFLLVFNCVKISLAFKLVVEVIYEQSSYTYR